MKHTLSTASKATGLGRSTIQRAIKSGRLSATKDDTGAYAIDPAELHRVFPPVPAEQLMEGPLGHHATPAGTGETAALEATIDGLEAQLARERETVDDLRRRLDISDEERRRLTLMITNQRSETRITNPDTKFTAVDVFSWCVVSVMCTFVVIVLLNRTGILPI